MDPPRNLRVKGIRNLRVDGDKEAAGSFHDKRLPIVEKYFILVGGKHSSKYKYNIPVTKQVFTSTLTASVSEKFAPVLLLEIETLILLYIIPSNVCYYKWKT